MKTMQSTEFCNSFIYEHAQENPNHVYQHGHIQPFARNNFLTVYFNLPEVQRPEKGSFVEVGIYALGVSLYRDSVGEHRQCSAKQCSCGGGIFVSASFVYRAVCLSCGRIISSTEGGIHQTIQMYYACLEQGLLEDSEMLHLNVPHSFNYFVV